MGETNEPVTKTEKEVVLERCSAALAGMEVVRYVSLLTSIRPSAAGTASLGLTATAKVSFETDARDETHFELKGLIVAFL